jgi:hypothetical protein
MGPEEGSQPWLELDAISRVKPSALHSNIQKYEATIQLQGINGVYF